MSTSSYSLLKFICAHDPAHFNRLSYRRCSDAVPTSSDYPPDYCAATRRCLVFDKPPVTTRPSYRPGGDRRCCGVLARKRASPSVNHSFRPVMLPTRSACRPTTVRRLDVVWFSTNRPTWPDPSYRPTVTAAAAPKARVHPRHRLCTSGGSERLLTRPSPVGVTGTVLTRVISNICGAAEQVLLQLTTAFESSSMHVGVIALVVGPPCQLLIVDPAIQ